MAVAVHLKWSELKYQWKLKLRSLRPSSPKEPLHACASYHTGWVMTVQWEMDRHDRPQLHREGFPLVRADSEPLCQSTDTGWLSADTYCTKQNQDVCAKMTWLRRRRVWSAFWVSGGDVKLLWEEQQQSILLRNGKKRAEKNIWSACSGCESEMRWVWRHTGTTTDKPTLCLFWFYTQQKQKFQPELLLFSSVSESDIKKGNTLLLKRLKIELFKIIGFIQNFSTFIKVSF